MKHPENDLTGKSILKFSLPLQLTWLMMAIEGPFLAAVIARLADPKFNLAAYGLALSFAMIAEAPIIMMLSAANALSRDRLAFQKMRRFTILLNGSITAFLLGFLFSPLFFLVTKTWMDLPAEIVRLTRQATLLFLPWPAAIGYRRFFQGIMIRWGQTRPVAYGTFVRLGSMAACALFFSLFSPLPGALVGAISLSTGVVMEAAASRWMARKIVRQIAEQPATECTYGLSLSFSYIWRFYIPLALTSMITLALHPLTSFFMGKSRFPIISLAILPVLNSMAFIFRSSGMAYQEVAIALPGEDQRRNRQVNRFGLRLGLITSSLFALIAFSPLATFWFRSISGLSNELADFAIWPARVLSLLPLLEALISLQRGNLVNRHRTGPIIAATAIQGGAVFLILFILVSFGHWIGVRAAAVAQVSGYLMANLFLMIAAPTIWTFSRKPGQGIESIRG